MELSHSDNAALLAENPVFRACSSIDIARLVPHVQALHNGAGEFLYTEGKSTDFLYLVKSGKVIIKSRNRFLGEILPGQITGLESAMDLDAYQTNAQAVEDITALAIPAAVILPLMRRNQSFSAKVHRSFLNLFTHIDNSATAKHTPPLDADKFDIKLATGWLVAIILPLVVMMFGDRWGFNWNEKVFMAVALTAIVMWIFAVVAEFVPTIFAMLSLVILGVVPESVVLSGFTSSSFFMAIGVFGLGAVLVSSGLTYRVVLNLLKILPKRQSTIGLGLMGVGIVLTPIIPTANGRAGLIAPIYSDMLNTLRYQFGGKAASALAITAFIGISLFSPVFLTSKSVNFVVYGMLPDQIREQFTWLYWLGAGLAAAAAMLLICAVMLKLMFKSKEPFELSRDKVQAQLDILGPVSPHEWAALIGISFLAIGIVTGSLHKISPSWVALIILYVFLTIGVFSKNQFRANIDWSFIFLLAGMIGIIKTMSYVGVDKMLSSQLTWLIPYMKNDFMLFVLLLSLAIIVVRFIIPNNPTIMIFAAIFIPVAESSGVNPWVIVFIILMMSDTWFLKYQSTYYIVFVEEANREQRYNEKSMLLFNMMSSCIRLAAIYVSIPYWKWLNII